MTSAEYIYIKEDGGKNNRMSNEFIKREQLLLLYENIIEEGYNLCTGYKAMHNKIISHINRNTIQDIMKSKINQCNELINLYNRLSPSKYVNKKVDYDRRYKLAQMFAKESNHGEMLNYIYSNTVDYDIKMIIQKIINDENLILCRLLYLQSLLGINWEADNK